MQRTKQTIAKEVEERIETPRQKKGELEGNTKIMISTGSTLLDLAISGGRKRGGGIPGGILVEISGLESTGKTVLLCEIAGAVERQGGEIMFHDPEGRLNKQFASIFGLHILDENYDTPDTIPEVFAPIRKWKPENMDVVNGIFADSLAALSTNLEMEGEEGDKMGMRRGKEFSEELRKTCRILTRNNFLMVCSNQLRENVDRAFKFSPKYRTPGGKGIPYYSSLRLSTNQIGTLKRKQTRKGKNIEVIHAIVIEVEVFKSSIWHPNRTAQVTIDFDYGIDNIRDSLKYLKSMEGSTIYCIGDRKLDRALDKSIEIVEDEELEDTLRDEVIRIWEEIEEGFKVERKPKKR